MYAEEIRRQAEDAPRAALPAVTKALWQAFSAGQVTEIEAETLSALIEIRQRVAADRRDAPRDGDAVALATTGPAQRHGSRPRTDASMERRRRWAASGRLPPQLAAKFTLGEQAVLSLIAAEVAKTGDCRLHIDHIGALTGVGRTTVKNALREARELGLLTVEERQITGWRNDSNIVRLTSPEWIAWGRLKRRETRVSAEGGGVRTATTIPTCSLDSGISGKTAPSNDCRRAADDPRRRDRAGSHPLGMTGRAMR